MDPICDTEQKGNTYWTKICKEYHEQKEYVEPHPLVTTRNVASLQHRWGIIQGEVNKYVGYYSQVTKHPQSGMGVATHVSSIAFILSSFAYASCVCILVLIHMLFAR